MSFSSTAPVIAVLGLGEAGSLIVTDLLAAGAVVRAYDPAVAAPAGTVGCTNEADAARGSDVVLSVNSAAAAADALAVGLDGRPRPSVWADLNTAGPELERRLAATADQAGVAFADVALMAPVPGLGLRTPMVVSGRGAAHYAEVMAPLGAQIEVMDAAAGEASQRKLLRSVFFKGMAAAVIEAVRAADTVGLADWMRAMIAAEFTRADEEFARRLEAGSIRHAVRRQEEMAAAAELLTTLGVPPRIAAASRDWLADLALNRTDATVQSDRSATLGD